MDREKSVNQSILTLHGYAPFIDYADLVKDGHKPVCGCYFGDENFSMRDWECSNPATALYSEKVKGFSIVEPYVTFANSPSGRKDYPARGLHRIRYYVEKVHDGLKDFFLEVNNIRHYGDDFDNYFKYDSRQHIRLKDEKTRAAIEKLFRQGSDDALRNLPRRDICWKGQFDLHDDEMGPFLKENSANEYLLPEWSRTLEIPFGKDTFVPEPNVEYRIIRVEVFNDDEFDFDRYERETLGFVQNDVFLIDQNMLGNEKVMVTVFGGIVFRKYSKPVERLVVPHFGSIQAVIPTRRGRKTFNRVVDYCHYKNYYDDIHYDPVCEEVASCPPIMNFVADLFFDEDEKRRFTIELRSPLSENRTTLIYPQYAYCEKIRGNRYNVYACMDVNNYGNLGKYASEPLTVRLKLYDQTVAQFRFRADRTQRGTVPVQRML